MTEFKATHRVYVDGQPRYDIMLHREEGEANGVGYTREEWKSESLADWEFEDGEWRFLGRALSELTKAVEIVEL